MKKWPIHLLDYKYKEEIKYIAIHEVLLWQHPAGRAASSKPELTLVEDILAGSFSLVEGQDNQ